MNTLAGLRQTNGRSLFCGWIAMLAFAGWIASCTGTISDWSSASTAGAGDEGEEEGQDPSDDTGGGSAPGDAFADQEVCDGWDNDGDGLIDEDTGGDVCTPEFSTMEQPDELTWRCIRGDLVCTECAPGAERLADCGCNIARVDVCDERGRWLFGVCDGCEQPFVPCECTPGESKIERCDTCVGDDCGATCVGAEYRCNDDCQWELVEDCATREPECDRDQFLEDPCGNCGTRHTVCDGCFWVVGKCEEQGVCSPGDSLRVPFRFL